jgi:hypothetical protein
MIWNYARAPHTVSHNLIRGNISVDDARKHAYGAIHTGTSGAGIRDIEVEGNVVVLGTPTEAAATALWIGPGSQDVRVRGNSFWVSGDTPFTDIQDDPVQVQFRANRFRRGQQPALPVGFRPGLR